MEAPHARRIARERSKVSFDATLREKGGFSDFGDRKLSGWPCVETPASRCPKLRQDKARAPIVDRPLSEVAAKSKEIAWTATPLRKILTIVYTKRYTQEL